MTKYRYHLDKGEHLLQSKCYMFYYLYKHYLKGTAGIDIGVVTGCLYSERLVIHRLYNINGKMRELLNPVPLSFWSIVRSGVNIRFGIELESIAWLMEFFKTKKKVSRAFKAFDIGLGNLTYWTRFFNVEQSRYC